MAAPESFRVGLPGSFGWLVHRFGKQVPKIDGLDGPWLKVGGGPLPLDIAIRVDQAEDGRSIVTGLLIGLDDRREITWETLRQIKLATVLEYIFSGLDPLDPASTVAEAMKDPDERVAKSSRIHRARVAVLLWQLWQANNKGSEAAVETIIKPRASVAMDLTAFAAVYMKHLAANPNRATTATAKELHISRTTAIRRVNECRELGLIPQRKASR